MVRVSINKRSKKYKSSIKKRLSIKKRKLRLSLKKSKRKRSKTPIKRSKKYRLSKKRSKKYKSSIKKRILLKKYKYDAGIEPTCPTCTYENIAGVKECDICKTTLRERSKSEEDALKSVSKMIIPSKKTNVSNSIIDLTSSTKNIPIIPTIDLTGSTKNIPIIPTIDLTSPSIPKRQKECKKILRCKDCTYENKLGTRECEVCRGTNLEPKETSELPNVWSKSVRKTLSDGNCFYSSIFRALRDKNLDDCIENLGLDKDNETESIKKLRDIVADNSREKLENIIKDREGLECFANCHKNFESTAFSDLYKILTEKINMDNIVNKIRQDKIWATDFEFGILSTYLDGICGIKLKIIYDCKSISDEDDLDLKNVIYLYNPHGVHFEYFHK